MGSLEATLIYADEGLGVALCERRLVLPDTQPQPQIEQPVRTPGAMGGWFELAVSFGVVALPAGVLASCIANWLTAAAARRRETKGNALKARLVLERDGRYVEVEISAADAGTISEMVRNALERIYPE